MIQAKWKTHELKGSSVKFCSSPTGHMLVAVGFKHQEKKKIHVLLLNFKREISLLVFFVHSHSTDCFFNLNVFLSHRLLK